MESYHSCRVWHVISAASSVNKSEISGQCILQPPKNREIIDLPVALMWFDDDGILYSITKNIPRTMENVTKTLEIIKEKLGQKKVCLISDTSQTRPYTREMRNELARQMPILFKAVALVPCSPMGKMMSTILFIKPNSPPARMFDTVEEAKDWIRQFCKTIEKP